MRRVWGVVAVCAAFGLLLTDSGATLAAAGAEQAAEAAHAEEALTFTRDVLHMHFRDERMPLEAIHSTAAARRWPTSPTTIGRGR